MDVATTDPTRRRRLIPSDKNNAPAVLTCRPRTTEVSSRYRSPTPTRTGRCPSPSVTRPTVSSASQSVAAKRAVSADRKRPSTPLSPTASSTPIRDVSIDLPASSRRLSTGRLPESLWPSTMRSLSASFQSDSVSVPVSKKERTVRSSSVDRTLRPSSNIALQHISIQPQPSPEKLEIEKPALALEQPVSVFAEEEKDETAETVVEIVHTHGPLETNEAPDSPLVIESQENVMAEEKEEDVKEERTPKQKNSAGKENKKSRKKDSPVTTTTTTTTTTTQAAECQESSDVNQSSTPGLPSYMQATKSAKAKLRLQQGSSSPKQQGAEKATRRYSLPSSGNNARVTSDSPKTTRVSNSGGKTGKKTEKPSAREGNGKTAQVEWKR